MGMLDNWKNLKAKAEALKLSDLQAFRQMMLFVIVADIFGVYWWLKMRNLGIAILIISLICMGIILYLERNAENDIKEEKMPKKKKKKKTEEDESKEDNLLGNFNVDLGVGSSDDYNKRLKNAIG